MPSDTTAAGEPPPRLEVRLLGGAEVVLDGERLRPFDAPGLRVTTF